MPELYNFSFPVKVTGNFTEISPTISLARAQIFYKGLNRNSTYISEEFAAKLLASIVYAPVKGIYVDGVDENPDFTDHGVSPSQGRIYGFVPKEHNVRWEESLDEDGVMRTYATVDVIIWTALYKESKEIVGKDLSMEIYPPSIKGQWTTVDGHRAFAFKEGIFQGLQVLGEKYNPCFEGAGFFSLYDAYMQLYTYIEAQANKITGGQVNMPMNFNLSDREKYDLLWNALNPNYNAESGYLVEMGINDVFEDYALCYNYEEHSFYRVFFTKGEGTLEITSKEKRFVLDVSESEFNALSALRTLIEADNYELVSQKFTDLSEQITANTQTIADLNAQILTYTATPEGEGEAEKVDAFAEERSTLTATIDSLTQANATLNTQLEGLTVYKLERELTEKRGMVEKYSTILSEEVLALYTDEKLGTFTVEDLKRDLAAAYVDSTPTLFTKKDINGRLPKDEYAADTIESILQEYRNKNQTNPK